MAKIVATFLLSLQESMDAVEKKVPKEEPGSTLLRSINDGQNRCIY
jgi:hypothetical protein